jgi:response regulator RpfG family c-di-GMP phosphodiesterase
MSTTPSKSPVNLAPWKVLLVDDEPDIHDVTKLTLRRFELDDRGLEFLDAYSGIEAKEILLKEHDIALVFLDVVMETEHSGLELARWIRQDLKNLFTRIILRTGQPGQAPEERVIVDYDINDYREKTDLDRTKLFTATYAALRAYRDITAVEEGRKIQVAHREGLERVLIASTHVFQQRNMHDFAKGLLEQVVTLLNLDHSMLLRVQGASGVVGSEDYEVLAKVGTFDDEHLFSPKLLENLHEVTMNHISHFSDDTYIGYFPSESGKASLLVLQGVDKISELDAKLLEVFSAGISVAFENILLNQEISDTQNDLILLLGDVVEARSPEAGDHVRRMADVCYLLGMASGMGVDEAVLLKQASPMHDIGKLATPDSAMMDPNDLDAIESEIMKLHAEIGMTLLHGSRRPILRAASLIAHQHHEKFDGSGYPQGLAGEHIHLYARIVAVADVFDVLMHRPGAVVNDVIEQLKSRSGTHLDPAVVSLLIENINEAAALMS